MTKKHPTIGQIMRLVALVCLGAWLVNNTHAALIGYWNFDEGTGTVAADTSGVAAPHNGTLTTEGAGALPQWINGRFGKALDFNRVSDSVGSKVTVPNQADLWLNNAFTLSFWYRPGASIGTFPGPMRIGSQTATSGNTIGWGFFRNRTSNTITYKRGNVQPGMYPTALVNGNWYHVVLRHDGNNANTAIIFGLSTNNTTQTWLDCTSTAVFEFGRMDQMDDCDLDDIAFFDEALPLERIYSLNSVPTKLGLAYSLADVRALWNIFDGGPGSSGVVQGRTWTYTASLPGSTTVGDAYLYGTKWYVVLGSGAGVEAPAIWLGDFSPVGLGVPGTLTAEGTPEIAASARFVFDLGAETTAGGGVNDLIEINGDLIISSNVVVINPIAPLAAGTYRLMNYTGTKTGSFDPVVIHNSRYTMTLDESTTGQINLTVAGEPASLQWISATSGSWNFAATNWTNAVAMMEDQFRQADRVRFDDSQVVQTNITVTGDVYPSAMDVASSTLNYTFSGTGRIGGLAGGLTKTGTNRLTLSTANMFLGPVNLNEGVLRLGNASALGANSGGTIVATGATLDLGGFSPGAEPITVGGTGVGDVGAIVNGGAGLINSGLAGTVTLTADTTLGGASRFDIYGGRIIGGGFKLTKTGTAEIALAHLGDTGLGEMDVLQGQLTVLGNTTLGDNTKRLHVAPGATLAFWAAGTNILDKPLNLDSGRLLNATGGGDVATNLALVTLAGTNTVEGSASVALMGELAGSGRLNKNQAGSLILAGSNTFAGTLTVNAGRVALIGEGAIGGASNVILAANSLLDVSGRSDATFTLAENQTLAGSGTVRGNLTAGTNATVAPGLSAGTLTVTNGLSLTGGATLVYELNAAAVEGGGTNDLINVGGNLTLAGMNQVKIVPLAPLDTSSPYTLISYAGALTGGAENLEIISDSRYNFFADSASVPNKIVLLTTGEPGLLRWVGGTVNAPRAWDVKTTPNWTGVEQFYSGDAVIFDDSATEFNVELMADLSPASLSLEADTHDYTFTGPGRIRGGALTKLFNGKVTLANSGINDYPGSTTISAGTLQVGDGGTVGNLGPAPVVNNATLILNRSDDLTWANTMTGTGTLQKDNTNQLFLGASMAGFDGNIVANGGWLRPTVATGLGTATGQTVVNSGAAMQINGINFGAERFSVAGVGPDGTGALINSGGGQNNALRFVTLTGDATFNSIGRFDVRSNPDATFTGNGFALTKLGASQFSLVSVGDTGLGDINVMQGVLSIEGTTFLGTNGVLNVGSNATAMFWGSSVVQNKTFALNGGARLFKDNGAATITGPGTLTGSNSVEAASNSGTDFTLAGPIGGEGRLNKVGAGNVFLTGENTYTGGTLVSAGNLLIGNGGGSGSVVGDIVVNSALYYYRSNEFTLSNNITGPGNVFLRTTTTGSAILDGASQISIGGNLEVGRDIYGKLIIREGASPVVGRINLGNVSGTVGEVVQEGGDVWVTLEARIGHWGNNESRYLLGGGTLNITNTPVGVVNPSGVAEQNGILYLGVDGTGIFTQTGGVATAHGIVLDARGNTAGTDTFNLEGGVFNIGPSGLKSGSLDANASYLINLGGGTLASWGSWTSVLNMTLTGLNGDTVMDTAGNLVRLNGVLSGVGGLRKTGEGSLILQGNNAYAGTTLVEGGVLAGNGTLVGPVVIAANGTLSPGLSIGTMVISNTLSLGGTNVMEISKSTNGLTSDLITGVSTQVCGGTLVILASGDPLAAGDSFNLFDAAVFEGSFAALELPVLPAGLMWNTSKLVVDGTVSVMVASQPSFAAPTRVGNDLVLSGSGGAPGAAYRVLASDAVTAPLANWTEVATGNFDANGNFSSNIPIAAENLQRYHIIVYP